MRPRTPLAIATILALVGLFALSGGVLAAETTLTATLSGSADTDEDGSGMATVVLDPEAGTACWEMTTENIAPATISHIHEGAEGVDGGVVVDLDLDGFDGSSEGCNEAADAMVLQEIIDNPAGFYVNIHNADHPGGAIRGQLAAASPNTAMTAPSPFSLPVLGVVLLLAAGLVAIRSARPVSPRA